MPDLISTGIQGTLGIAQLVSNLIKSGEAKSEAARLEKTRPKYKISPLVGEDLALAESDLGTGGLSANSKNAYEELNNRQFSSSLSAILRGGGSVNNVADVFDASEAGRLRLAELNDEMRLQKVNNLVRARRYANDERDKEFEFNQWMPWSDKSQAVAEARRGSESGIWSGLGTIGSAAMRYGQSVQDEKAYSGYSGNNSSGDYMSTSGGGGGDRGYGGTQNSDPLDGMDLTPDQKQRLYDFLRRGQ